MRIELEITLRCNWSCKQCNRHCNAFDFMPLDDTDMTLGQIDRFCSQVEARGQRLSRLSVLGGEPLLHPHLGDILSMLDKRLHRNRLVREIRITTNGSLLQKMHPKIFDNTMISVGYSKTEFLCSQVAPGDNGQKMRHCPVPSHCGIALNCWGYWPCGPGGAIARLFGMTQYQRFDLPEHGLEDFGPLDEFGNINELCRLCQWSAKKPMYASDSNCQPSKSYRKAIESYKANPVIPTLRRF